MSKREINKTFKKSKTLPKAIKKTATIVPDVIEGEVTSKKEEPIEDNESSNEFLDNGDIDLPSLEGEDTESQEDPTPLKPVKIKDLVTYNPLQAYLKDISRYHILSKEEERELALKVFENKDRDSAYKLITSHLWLAVKVARDYERAAKNIMDLIQEGNIGLMEAVKNFNPHKEVRFPSYAVWWVKAYIIRYIMANLRLVKIGTTQAQRKLFFNLNKEKERLAKEGFFPSPKLIASNLSVKESEVIDMEQRMSGADVSMDAPLNGEEDSSSLLSVLPSSASTAEDALSLKESKELLSSSIDAFMQTLKENETIIFKERLLSEDKATLQDLSNKLKISKERVRQLENKIKDRLKVYLLAKLGPSVTEELL